MSPTIKIKRIIAKHILFKNKFRIISQLMFICSLYKENPGTILANVLAVLIFLSGCGSSAGSNYDIAMEPKKIPVIDVTDTYHPYQDPGDNFDLIMAYALPEIDLKAIIFDVTEEFLKPVANHPILYNDPNGPREPGIIPVMQLNYIFNRDVPFGVGPYTAMDSPEDKMLDAPGFQQKGVELILKILQESNEPVHILSFGSARPVAVAYNRNPELFHSKVKQIHLSAGTASPDYRLGNSPSHNAIPGGEWNVALDSAAFIRMLRSDLPIAIYPCATKDGAFELGAHNTHWKLPNLHFINQMDPELRNYLNFAFSRKMKVDFLQAMDTGVQEDLQGDIYEKPHSVWETAVWMQVANRALVNREDGTYRLIPADEIVATDKVLENDLKKCKVNVRGDGRFDFKLTNEPTNFSIYKRGNPHENEKALQEALPHLYMSFEIPHKVRNNDEPK
jgi:pyrimidine-specific ribonucleoside hydrolase